MPIKKYKVCYRCKKKLLVSFFYKRKSGTKDGLLSWCKKCEIKRLKAIRIKYPWYEAYAGIFKRCYTVGRKDYKWYGGKGIERKITRDEVKYLWFRDKAYNMKKPSIDRIDSDGHYTIKNCRFIEHSENASRKGKK